jgi:acylphosphatase
VAANRYIVEGRVQGVGFRYFVVQTAERLGCVGEVWNRRDGGVELVASHPDSDVLLKFADELRHGPGRVDSVVTDFASEQGYEGFEIASTR